MKESTEDAARDIYAEDAVEDSDGPGPDRGRLINRIHTTQGSNHHHTWVVGSKSRHTRHTQKKRGPTSLKMFFLTFSIVVVSGAVRHTLDPGMVPHIRKIGYSSRIVAPQLCVLPSEQQSTALRDLLNEANLEEEPDGVTEMSAGFCNWVYRVDYPKKSVVAKLFSPLAKLRLAPELRGVGDELAGAKGLGPVLHYRSADGLVSDYIQGDTLTERELHAPATDLPTRIAPRLAALHGPPQLDTAGQPAVLWEFLESMLEHTTDDAIPASMPLAQACQLPIARLARSPPHAHALCLRG